MSSYDPVAADDLITPEEFRESMKLVRLQIAIPISVLIALGANLVCALALKPGLGGLNAVNPTLLSPSSIFIGVYWAFLFILQVGFCLLLLLVRKTETKETLVNGIGIRFAIANWIQAAWAVAFLWIVAEVLILINVINVLSIHLTLLKYPQTLSRPMDTVLIHAPTTLLLAILFELDWLHNGFIALGWVTETRKDWGRHTWQAVIGIAAVNVIVALWAGFRRQYSPLIPLSTRISGSSHLGAVAARLGLIHSLFTLASEYLLFSLLFSSPRSQPTLPSSQLPKPTPLLITLIICLVLHPLALVAGIAWRRTRDREGRIRLEEEVEEAEREQRDAEIEAAAAAGAAHARRR